MVVGIEPDQDTHGHHYAYIGNYLPFDSPVPWRRNGRYAEAHLRELQEKQATYTVGRSIRGKSVRPLEQTDFNEIVLLGLSKTLASENAVRIGLDTGSIDAQTQILLSEYHGPIDRKVEQILVNKKIRDANFREIVCEAYDNRCSFTHLKIVNGGGRAEVQAAHILPVSEGGPDVIQNGIALSATAHWLFDRHLVSISDDF